MSRNCPPGSPGDNAWKIFTVPLEICQPMFFVDRYLYLIDKYYGRVLRFNTIDFTMTKGFMGKEVNQFGIEGNGSYFLQCNKEIIGVCSTTSTGRLMPYGHFSMNGFVDAAWALYKYSFSKAAWEALADDEIRGKSWFLSNCGAKFASAAEGTTVERVHFLSKLKRRASYCCRHRENLGVDTMEETWSCIPNLLIWMIMERLQFIDSLRLSAVCKHWLNAFHNFPKEETTSYCNFPWLMISKDHRGSERECFSPWTKTKFTVDLPEFAKTFVLNSKNGWVLLLTSSDCCNQVPRSGVLAKPLYSSETPDAKKASTFQNHYLYLMEIYGRALRLNTIDFTMTNRFMGKTCPFGTEEKDTYFLQCNKDIIRVSSNGMIPYGHFSGYGFTEAAWSFYKYSISKATWEALDDDEIRGKSWFLSNCGAKFSSAAEGTPVEKVHFLSKFKKKGSHCLFSCNLNSPGKDAHSYFGNLSRKNTVWINMG
ncbi:hypothetical protein RHMOL_Rhmol05G0025600 [Rhododendron molle]|uniref:Uncharacterized protein n=1 Tax=Rhododendron molle TaxID=49168 RepID=A0ACC0NJX4_RHOML|nr:hypothetical protein RHMOL_Rhmol05G0025600 [Rhododendron molle]